MKTAIARVLLAVPPLLAVMAAWSSFGCNQPDCPQVLIDRTATVSLSSDDACGALAYLDKSAAAIPASACATLCKDSAITQCNLPRDYVLDYEGISPKSADASANCPPLSAGETSVSLTCQVTHTEGTSSAACPAAG